MKPISSKYKSRCPEALASKCVSWDGPNIPCLDICHDDVLTDVVHAIGTKVCEIAGELDLETLDLGCLIDLCDTCPNEKSLKIILQLILDNQCKLNDLIEDIIRAINSGGSGSGAIVLNLNYKCIEKYDAFDNPIPQDLNQTLQSIIDELCAHKVQLEDHEERLTIIETTYCKSPCGEGGSGYVEPVIDLCTSTVPKVLSLAVIDLGNDYCDYKPIVGEESEILSAISKQPNLTTDPNYTAYLADGLIINADYNSLGDSEFNQWVLIKSLLQRVNTIETTCCAPSCEDIHIGFDATYDEDTEEYTLEFTYAAGTEIPVGVEDCGSVMILTDTEGKTKTIPITIENGLVFTIPSVAPLSTKDPISVTIKTCFTFPNGLNCKDCVGGVLPAVQPCGFCKMCVVGGTSSDTLFVTYTKNGEMTSQSLRTGDCIYFENADVIDIISINSTATGMTLAPDPNNPCDSLIVPEITEAKCWFFKLPMSNIINTFIFGTELSLSLTVVETDMDLITDSSRIVTYSKLYTFTEPNGISISGPTITAAPDGSNTDNIAILNQIPVISNSTILSNTACLSPVLVGWSDGGNGHHSYGIQPVNANVTLDYKYTFPTIGTSRFGVMLKIMAQPDNVPPMIEMFDPITETYMSVKGTLIDDCDCESI